VTGVAVEEKPPAPTRDEALIEAGTHFYCWGHGGICPIEEQSVDPCYCQACLDKQEFSAARDRALIEAGTHFYCQGHLGARPIEEQSEDPRYCRSCCVFLSQEAEQSHSRAAWVPRVKGKRVRAANAVHDTPPAAPQPDRTPLVKGDTIPAQCPVPSPESQPIMSTPKPSLVRRRGPKQKNLPVGEIKRWEKEGLGSKRIAARLKGQGVEVSYKTIQRILNGQRKVEK
jgi:hypothetical protein